MIVIKLKYNRLGPESWGEKILIPTLYEKKILTGKLINYLLAALSLRTKNNLTMRNESHIV